MKTSMSASKILSLLVVVCLFCIETHGAKAEGSTNSAADVRVAKWERGLPTNGIYGEVRVIWHNFDGSRHRRPIVEVGVVNTNRYGFYGEEQPHSIRAISSKVFADKLRFFLPTNEFCGPAELRNALGRMCTPLRPEATSPGNYPESFSLKVVRKGRSPPDIVFPRPITAASDVELARFSVSDYFAISEPGVYTLTVWPKIYERKSGPVDICERVDLTPVVVTFRFSGEVESTVKKGAIH